MTRYDVDKFITYVEGLDEEVVAFVADPPAYVAGWVQRGRESRVPVPNGGRLSDAEQRAIANVDYAALYAMGAHPYVLWHFTEAAFVWAGELTWPELKEQFREAVAEFGNPDFTT